MIFSIIKYFQIYRLHNKALKLFQRNDYLCLLPLAEKGIYMIPKQKDWVIENIHSVSLIVANLYLFRAKSLEGLSKINVLNIKLVIESYKTAIDLLANTPPNLTDINCFFSLIDFYICIHDYNKSHDECLEIDESKFGEECIQYAKRAEKIGSYFNSPDVQGEALARHADVINCFYLFDEEYINLSITYRHQAIKFFETLNNKEVVFSLKSGLAVAYINPVIGYNAANIERSLFYANEALSIKPDDVTEDEINTLNSIIATSFLFTPYGEQKTNQKIAKVAAEHSLENKIDSFEDKRPHETLHWIKLILSDGNNTKSLHDIEMKLISILETAKSSNDYDLHFDTLKICKKISTKPQSSFIYSHRIFLRRLKGLLTKVDAQKNPRLWIDIQCSIVGILYEEQNKAAAKPALVIYLSIFNDFEIKQWPHVNFSINIRISSCYYDLKQWKDASHHFKIAMNDFYQNIEKEFRGYSPGTFSFPEKDVLIRDAMVAATLEYDVQEALLCFDYLYSRKVAIDLEDLFLIEKQINRESLLDHYNRMKLSQRLLHMIEPDRKQNSINFIEKSRNKFEDLKKITPKFSRKYFYSYFQDQLQILDTWVFVPMLGSNQSVLLLIPPKSSMSEIHVFATSEINYHDEMKIFTDGYEKGWAFAINHINNKNNTQEYEENIGVELYKIAKHLWDNYISWVEQVLTTHSHQKTASLCIIATGTLLNYPFSLAENLKTGKRLIDIAEISYAPSLYGKFSLQERLDSFEERPSLSFVAGSNDKSDPVNHLKYLEMEYSLVSKQFSNENKHFLDHQTSSIETIKDQFKKTNHWHIASHGEYHWGNSETSHLKIFDKELTLSLLNILEVDDPLRLVILSGCETGLHNFLVEDGDAEGLLYKFLSLGSLGTIGSLWKINDEASALLMGKFYKYYLKDKIAPASALRKAQLWLKNSNRKKIESYIHKKFKENKRDENILELLENLKSSEYEEMPFEDPTFWAGMIYIGV